MHFLQVSHRCPAFLIPVKWECHLGAVVGQSWALARWGELKRYIWVDVREGLE